MRPSSAADASWAKGLCFAWGVLLHSGAADPPPASEDAARDERYGFLLELKEHVGASWLLTGHHGDDQAETVLFRVARGTGLKGLAGIPKERPPGIYRPLLPFLRKDLSDHAAARGIRYRMDPTNRDLTYPRNLLRHQILPGMEAGVAPGVRDSLRRLATLAEENEAAWKSLIPRLLEGVLLADGRGQFVVRSRLLAYHPAVQARLLREILGRSGISLDEAGTRRAVEFTRTGVSGRSLTLPGGRLLVREFDQFRLVEVGGSLETERSRGGGLSAEAESSQDMTCISVPDSDSGSGRLRLGDAEYLVVWGPGEAERCAWTLKVPRDELAFPLSVRGWNPGDRIHMPYGTKKLKKLFAEARIPAEERGRRPVFVDAKKRVLWVAGVASSTMVQARSGSRALFLGIRYVDGS